MSPQLLGPDGTDYSFEPAKLDEAPDDPVARLKSLIEARGEDSVHVLRHWMDDRKETR